MSKFRASGKWQAGGPARTNTGSSIRGKISAPIPFPDDDEFPIRTPGTGIATPLGTDRADNRLRQSTIAETAEIDNTPGQPGIAVSDFVEPMSVAQPIVAPEEPSPEPQSQRNTPPELIRNSIASVPSRASVRKSATPQRKKSSLKSVFGRLFGKKSKKPEEGQGGPRVGQHRSDPTALNRPPHSPSSAQKRSASLPINEFNRALRSHSIVLADDFAIQDDNEIKQESVQENGQRRPRRATTASRLYAPNHIPGYVDWKGLSPRPASSHARGSRAITDAEADAVNGGIGMAVSSGLRKDRRRSRSLAEMRETAGPSNMTRRRSDEIRYWRESYDPGLLSPMSSNKAEAEKPILTEDTQHREPQEEVQPLQPFNFGPLGEMAGMKITKAVNLETRVQRLEEKMHKMERMVYRSNRPEHIQLQDPPKRNSNGNDRSSPMPRPTTDDSEMSLPQNQRHREIHPSRSVGETKSRGSQKRSSSYGSSRPSTTSTHVSYHHSFDTVPSTTLVPSEPHLTATNFARPLSTSTTIRAIPSSSPTMPKDGTLTGEHYIVLTNMILAEQAARQQLEILVHNLQQQVQMLLSSTSANYPTPNSNPPGEGPLHASAPTRDFSSFEDDDTSDDEGRFAHDEVYQTPNEENPHFGDEIFGTVNADGDMKSAPRTLSLSQITLGRGMQPSLNF